MSGSYDKIFAKINKNIKQKKYLSDYDIINMFIKSESSAIMKGGDGGIADLANLAKDMDYSDLTTLAKDADIADLATLAKNTGNTDAGNTDDDTDELVQNADTDTDTDADADDDVGNSYSVPMRFIKNER